MRQVKNPPFFNPMKITSYLRRGGIVEEGVLALHDLVVLALVLLSVVEDLPLGRSHDASSLNELVGDELCSEVIKVWDNY